MAKEKFDNNLGAKELFNAAALKISPPAHTELLCGAEPFYNAILKSRESSMWNDVDLGRAVTLANHQLMIRENTKELMKEGEIVVNDRGTQIMNPRFSVVNTLTRLEMSLSKALQTNAASTQGESRAVRKRNAAGKSARAAVSLTDNDPLLARVDN